jgi:hypothetical protein
VAKAARETAHAAPRARASSAAVGEHQTQARNDLGWGQPYPRDERLAIGPGASEGSGGGRPRCTLVPVCQRAVQSGELAARMATDSAAIPARWGAGARHTHRRPPRPGHHAIVPGVPGQAREAHLPARDHAPREPAGGSRQQRQQQGAKAAGRASTTTRRAPTTVSATGKRHRSQ